jgi:hypothetical protein
VRRNYSSPATRALRQPCRAPRVLVSRLQQLYINSASRRLVVDYFVFTARLGASTRRAARHVARRAARRRLLRLLQAHRRLLRLTQARRRLLVVDYFASAARPGASARRAARHAARRAARHRLLRLRRASECLGTSRGSPLAVDYSASRRLVVDNSTSRRLVVDYFASAARPGASARRTAHCRLLRVAQSRRRLLRAPRLRLAATLALLQPRRASRLLVSRQHWLYFEYAAHRRDIVFWSHRVDHSSRLVLQTSRERRSRPQQLVGINSD